MKAKTEGGAELTCAEGGGGIGPGTIKNGAKGSASFLFRQPRGGGDGY